MMARTKFVFLLQHLFKQNPYYTIIKLTRTNCILIVATSVKCQSLYDIMTYQ